MPSRRHRAHQSVIALRIRPWLLRCFSPNAPKIAIGRRIRSCKDLRSACQPPPHPASTGSKTILRGPVRPSVRHRQAPVLTAGATGCPTAALARAQRTASPRRQYPSARRPKRPAGARRRRPALQFAAGPHAPERKARRSAPQRQRSSHLL